MILFVFEGENREPTLFKTLEYLYFSKNKQIRICSYKNNIYDLYKRMNETDEPEDIVSILKNKLVADKDNPLKEIRRRSDFSQIYLFFDYDSHRSLHNLSKELNKLYKEHPECWENDENWEGFNWASCNEAGKNALAFRRIAKDGSELLFAFNFCPNEYRGFHVEVPENSKWEEILSTDETRFGGSGWFPNGTRASWHEGYSNFAAVDLAPFSAVIFKKIP